MAASVRPATAADVERLVALMRDFYDEDGDAFNEDESRASFAALVATPAWGGVWVADEAGALVGYVALTWGFSMEFGGRDAFIDDLYVVASRRSEGIGRALIAACEAACNEVGVRALHLGVRPTNPAVSLYRRVGFREQEHRLMTKRLSGQASNGSPLGERAL
jgi:diamine N-acetyltransferase